MPIRYGISFPAWFSPNFPPTPPEKPKIPQQIYKEAIYILVEEMYIDSSTINNLIESIRHYNSEDFSVRNEKEGFISIYRRDWNEIIIPDKEFAKSQKEYERKIKDYERLVVEYEQRMKKYSSMLLQHEGAKYRSMLNKAEDEMDDAKVAVFNNESIIKDLEKVIAECKDKLSKIINEQQDTFE